MNNTDILELTSHFTRILEIIGEDPAREGLRDTPKRVAKSYAELFSGYGETDMDKLRTSFTIQDNKIGQLIVLRDIEFFSMCEHHMLPFIGKAHVAYICSKKVIGVSKLARIVDHYAKRLQIQERICDQVVDFLQETIQPTGCACLVSAKHLCMQMRGVQKQHSVMVTSALRGVFLDPTNVSRMELMSIIGDIK